MIYPRLNQLLLQQSRRLYTTPASRMAPTVLGIGIPAAAAPPPAREKLQKALDVMDSDMDASPYEWDMLYIMPDGDFDIITKKMREKQWDVIMIGSESEPGFLSL